MSRQLYFECASGISGDMTVAALLDLGADEKTLRETLGTLPIEEPYEIHISRVKKSSLDVCDFLVKLPRDGEFLDHDMEYLHGHLHEHDHDHESEAAHDHGHDHDHDHGHTHSHGHEHDHSHTHAHAHGRGPDEIRGIFEVSSMTDGAKAIANRILQVLAEAEAAVHGTDVSLVHFHEAGAVDSIIDIAATAICLDNLAVDGVIFTELCEGPRQCALSARAAADSGAGGNKDRHSPRFEIPFSPGGGRAGYPHRRGNRGGDSHIGYVAGIHKDSRVRHGSRQAQLRCAGDSAGFSGGDAGE